jgi:hypothetical protein
VDYQKVCGEGEKKMTNDQAPMTKAMPDVRMPNDVTYDTLVI